MLLLHESKSYELDLSLVGELVVVNRGYGFFLTNHVEYEGWIFLEAVPSSVAKRYAF